MYARSRDEWDGDLSFMTYGKNKMYTTDAVSGLVLLSDLTPQKQCGKPDYKKKGIVRNIPTISCCILSFKILYAHASGLTHLL